MNNVNNKFVCNTCVKESYLVKAIQDLNRYQKCSYCHNDGYCISIIELSKKVETVLETHFEYTPFRGAFKQWDPYKDYKGDSLTYEIVSLVNANENISTDLIHRMATRQNDYSGSDGWIWSEKYQIAIYYKYVGYKNDQAVEKWGEFKESLLHESRFYNKDAKNYLDTIFATILEIERDDNLPVTVTLIPGENSASFYRARVLLSFNQIDEVKADPEKKLGSPPKENLKAGRMNAHGISLFYGAFDEDTALNEVRPSVGSYVAAAKFEVIHELTLLDLSALKNISRPEPNISTLSSSRQGHKVKFGTKVYSIFDPVYQNKIRDVTFLSIFSERLSTPIMPGSEALDYIPTQYISEYIENQLHKKYDGIIFPSTQRKGKKRNVALFHKASLVENGNDEKHSHSNPRSPSLRLDKTSLRFHRIEAINYEPQPI